MQAMRMKLSVLSVVFGLVSMAVPAAAQQCTWSALGSGVRGDVNAMRGFDTGSGPILYTGGSFLAAGGVGALNLARWDGTQWLPTCYGATSQVLATLIFDDGTGPALYVAGIFDNIQGVPANGIAKWDGKQWSALGLGLQFPDGSAGRVNALAGFDDGTGPALYVGGRFSIAGGAPANFIAKWDGKRWSPLGSGMDRPDVNALLVFDDGTGPALYAGGEFLQAGGVAANKMARWNGTQWSAVGLGMNEFVYDLALFDDGSGLALYACGPFTFAGGMAASSPSGTGRSGLPSAAEWTIPCFRWRSSMMG